MLIICPECNLQVSDKAFSCPHCGYPFKQNINPSVRRSTKKKRLPNGFGQITELKQNLRKPFRAMVTTGFTNEGKPIQKLLEPQAYFETYNDAYMALLEYNKNPFEFGKNITIEELFWKWNDIYSKNVQENSRAYIIPAWNRCKPIWMIRIKNLRKIHIKRLLEDTEGTQANINQMKRLLNCLLDFAVEAELIERNFLQDINTNNIISKKNPGTVLQHNTFSIDEISTLWANKDEYLYAKYILLQCYMGWRPGEMLTLLKKNVNINEWSITGGLKTKNGKNRKVPVHSAIKDIVKELYYANNCEYLITMDGPKGPKNISMQTYWDNFVKLMAKLNMNIEHKPHDPRVTFVTLCKKYKVDEYAIKYMVGHSIKDLTEETYTRREFSWLQDEIEKIKLAV